MLTSACWCASYFVVASTSDVGVGDVWPPFCSSFFWKFSLSGCVMIDDRHLGRSKHQFYYCS